MELGTPSLWKNGILCSEALRIKDVVFKNDDLRFVLSRSCSLSGVGIFCRTRHVCPRIDHIYGRDKAHENETLLKLGYRESSYLFTTTKF